MRKKIISAALLVCFTCQLLVVKQGVSGKDASDNFVENDKLTAGVSYQIQQELIDVKEIKQELDVLDKTNIEPTIEPVEVFDGYENIETGERFSRDEGILLAAVVYAEARGESDTHQQYVASVVLNRVNSDEFPSTIYDVVYQRNPIQYACVENGQLDKALDLYATDNIDDETSEVLERCLENVAYVLTRGTLLPSDVVYQAEFVQGSGIAYQLDDTYFCFE